MFGVYFFGVCCVN